MIIHVALLTRQQTPVLSKTPLGSVNVVGFWWLILILNGSLMCHQALLSVFFTSSPPWHSFAPLLPGGLPPGPCGKMTCVIISTPLNEFTPQQVSWDDQQLVLVFMVTHGFSLTLVHNTGTTGNGETWIFMYVDRLKICKVTAASKACQDNYCKSCRHQSTEGSFSTGVNAGES